jgi:hypothetical protein
MVIFLLGWHFGPKDLAAGGCSGKSLGQRWFSLPTTQKVAGGAILKTAFANSFILGLEGAGSGVVDFGNVQVDSFLPVHFFRM